jgi:hypothetical protein
MKSLSESIEEIPIVSRCSLYRAICWIAFNEKPIEEALAKVVYQKHYEIEVINNEYEGSEWTEIEINWRDDATESKFKETCSHIHSLLILGKIQAWGYEESGDHWEKECIHKDFFDPLCLHIDWINSKASKVEESMCLNEKYEDLEIDTAELKKVLRQENIEKPKKGRKTKFNWHEIHAIITLYIHENGCPKNQTKFAEELYSICSQKLGEDNTPDIESIRKMAVRPVLNAFKDWEKE